ncbi:MAG: penicillin-binding protein 2 [Mariprofundaceae bacterium]|nr:penicillin-binding protein 2 [Mariprofundaceae bacterium]
MPIFMIANSLKMRSRFERRMFFLQWLAALLLLLLFTRLADLQWLQHEGLLLQAEQNRINVVPILPTRGEIIDRNGQGLAVNHVSYRLTLIPERSANIPAVLAQVQQLMQWPDKRLKRLKKRLAHSRRDRPILLADKLEWHEIAQVAARLHQLPGIDVQAGTHRFYPYGALTSHLIGYLSLARNEDLQHGVLPSEKTGRRGVERTFEPTLHGQPGSQYEEVDAHGRRISAFKRVPPKMGERLQLSLDVGLQQAASKALGERTGAVVVLDVNSGEVLALLSKPGFEPNRFITGLETEQWQAWVNDSRHPLINRAIQAVYPPASTFKLLVALAGLAQQSPLIHQSTQCLGYVKLGKRKLRCWKRRGHHRVDLHKALVESCDVYFYELGDQLGMSAISTTAQRWGFGEATGIAVGPEAVGSIPRTNAGRHWFRGEIMITAIGQGAVTASPLQLARFTAAIANGGILLKPHLLAGKEPEITRRIDVLPEQLNTIRKAMRDVVVSVHGTAHRAMSKLAWTSAGKTGTAQVVAEAQDEDKPPKGTQQKQLKRHRDHAWFIGYAPYEKPRIAFAVFVENGGHGGSAAAPVAAALVRYMAAQEDITAHKGQGS